MELKLQRESESKDIEYIKCDIEEMKTDIKEIKELLKKLNHPSLPHGFCN